MRVLAALLLASGLATAQVQPVGMYKVDGTESGHLPTQATHAGQWLTSDGTTASWAALTVAYSNITGITASRLLGRGSASSGAAQEITLGTGLTISGTTLTPDVSGSGAAGRLALWSSASGLTSDAGIYHIGSDVYASNFYGTPRTLNAFFSGALYGFDTSYRISLSLTGLGIRSTGLVSWAATDDMGTPDLSLSRIAPGVLGVGTGAAGSTAGTLIASKYSIFATTDTFMGYNGAQNAGYISFYESFTPVAALGANAGSNIRGLMLASGFRLSWGTIGGLPDTFIQRRAADTFLFGYEDSGTPRPQTITFSGSRGGTDTNTAGADATIQGSLGTGTAASGKIVFKVGTPTTTGSTQHVPATVLTLQDTGTGGVAAPQVLFADGTIAKPLLGIAGHPNSGINFSGYATQVIYNGATVTEFFGSEIYAYVPILAKVKIAPNTGTATPTATDSQTVYTNEGDADGSTITLPAASAGLQYTAIVQAAQTITITAATGDTIRIGSSVTATGGSITNANVGATVTLTAINATEWVATSTVGTAWTF